METQNNKLNKLTKLMELLSNDTITPKEVERFLTMVVQVIKDQKDQFQTISNKNLAEIDEAVKYLSNNYKEQLANIEKKATQDFNKEVKAVESKIEEVKKLVDEAIKMKPKDGEKGDAGYTPVLGKDYFTDKDKEVFKKDVVKELDLETVIDSKIKDFPKMEDFDNLNLKLNEFSSRKIPVGLEVFKDGKNLGRFPSINFKGGNIQASASRIDVDFSKSIEWGEIGGTLADQTDLVSYIADQVATADTLQEVTDNGATTTNTITLSPTGNNKALIANGSGSGAAIDITHAGSGTKLQIGSTGAGDMINAGSGAFVVNNNGQVGINRAPAGALAIQEPTNSTTRFFFYAPTTGNAMNMQMTDSYQWYMRHVWSGTDYNPIALSQLNGNVYFSLQDASVEYARIASVGDSFINAGDLVLGGTSADAKLHVISPSTQARFAYDTSNDMTITVDSSGVPTFNQTGDGVIFSKTLAVDGPVRGAYKFTTTGGSTTAKWWLANTSTGGTAWSNSMPGIELSAGGMNTTFKYTPAIKFGSTDPDLTTTNPKFNAYIAGYATEAYSSDTRTGMGLEFGVSATNGGTGSVAARVLTLEPATASLFYDDSHFASLAVASTGALTLTSTSATHLNIGDGSSNSTVDAYIQGSSNSRLFFMEGASQRGRIESLSNNTFHIRSNSDNLNLNQDSSRNITLAQGGGKVGIGAFGNASYTPNAFLEVRGTTEQLRIGYDSSNYTGLYTESDGTFNIDSTKSTIVVNGTATTNPRIEMENVRTVQYSTTGFTLRNTETEDGYQEWHFVAQKDGSGAGVGDSQFYIRLRNNSQSEAMTPFAIDGGTGDIYLLRGYTNGTKLSYGNVLIGGQASGTAKVSIGDSTQAQLGLNYSTGIRTTLQTDGSGNFNVTPNTGETVINSLLGVGITPTTLLHISGSAPIFTVADTSNNSGLRINVTGLDADNDSLMRFQDNGTTRLQMYRDGALNLSHYGSGNETGTLAYSLGVDSSGNVIEGPKLVTGTYTPTLTGVTNVASSTAYTCQYMQVGNMVTVSGQISVTPTTNNSEVTIGISLPVASNFGNSYELGGTAYKQANTDAGHGASIYADATNNRAEMDYFETHGGGDTFSFSFTYQII